MTEAQQAEFLTAAYRCLAADPIVTHAFWFGIQDIPGTPYPGGLGLFRHDGSAKPSVAAFAALAGGIPPDRAAPWSTPAGRRSRLPSRLTARSSST